MVGGGGRARTGPRRQRKAGPFAATGQMADDQSSKRPRTTSGAGGESTCDNESSEIHTLRSEVARLRQQLLRSDAEVTRLRRQLQRPQGSHDVLPVVTQTPTVDLSRLDPSLVTQIVSFLGTSIELRNLALTCKAFGWQQPSSTERDLSLAEQVARQVVCSGRNTVDARVTLPPYVRGTTTWLSILRESEHPLKFDKLFGCGIVEMTNERRTLIHTGYGYSSTVASNYVMISGIHYAEFHIAAGTHFGIDIGIVRPMPSLNPARYANCGFGFHFLKGSLFGDFLAARTEGWGAGNVHACQFSLYNVGISWTNWDNQKHEANWEALGNWEIGDTLGMLLNLDEGTLTVYKNNRRLGVMKDRLSGSYCWCATFKHDATITIKRCDPPTA